MTNQPVPSFVPVVPEQLRLLRSHERVQRGDLVRTAGDEFESWEGPGGFRADTFVQRIYRRLGCRPVKARDGT